MYRHGQPWSHHIRDILSSNNDPIHSSVSLRKNVHKAHRYSYFFHYYRITFCMFSKVYSWTTLHNASVQTRSDTKIHYIDRNGFWIMYFASTGERKLIFIRLRNFRNDSIIERRLLACGLQCQTFELCGIISASWVNRICLLYTVKFEF